MNLEIIWIWLSLRLIKKSPECLEYGLVHLLERHHKDPLHTQLAKP